MPGINICPARFGNRHGAVDRELVFLGNLASLRNDVRSVNCEARCDLANRAPDLGSRVVPAVAVVFANLHKNLGQPIHVASQRFMFHGKLLWIGKRVKILRSASEFSIDFADFFEPFTVH